MKDSRSLAALAGVCVFSGWAAAQPSLTLIGLGPAGQGSRVNAVSADGRYAAGTIAGGAFVWNRDTGRSDFASTEADVPDASGAYGVTNNGRVVGEAALAGGGRGAFLWNGPGAFQSLGTAHPVLPRSRATGVSGDGSVIVGISTNAGESTIRPFRWTEGGGMQLIPVGGSQVYATGVSRDGSTVVGWGDFIGAGTTNAFTWTADGGTQALQHLPGPFLASQAYGVNSDGTRVVGYSSTGHAALWTNGVPMDLGVAPGTDQSIAFCVNDDATVVGGHAFLSTNGMPLAAVWTPDTGMVLLTDYLISYGITIPTGWTPREVLGVSSDGKTLVGYGDNGVVTQGFVATIPSLCPADLDNDGDFSNGFIRDYAVTIDDLLYFLEHFEAGC